MLKEEYIEQLKAIRGIAHTLRQISAPGYENVKLSFITEEADKLKTRIEHLTEEQFKLVLSE